MVGLGRAAVLTRAVAGRGRPGQGAHLGGLEGPPRARLEAVVGEGPDAGAHQTAHGVADGLAHAADLAVAALVDDDAQHAGGDDAHRGRRRPAVVEVHPQSQAPQGPRCGGAVHLDEVLLLHPEGRMGEALGQGAVVGEDEQPFAVGVEPPHREDARFVGHELDHGGPVLRVVRGRDHPSRLVQEVVDQPGQHGQDHAVETDLVDGDVDTATELGPFAVDRHPSPGDQLFTGPPAPQADAGQDFLEALACGCVVSGRGPPSWRRCGGASLRHRRPDAGAPPIARRPRGRAGDPRRGAARRWRRARASPRRRRWCRTGRAGPGPGRGRRR